MNKNMKRVVSGLAALGIALSGMALGVSSAYADDDSTLAKAKADTNGGTITITNQADDSAEHTLNGYRLGWMYEVTSNDDGSLDSFQIDTNDKYVTAIESALGKVDSGTPGKTLFDLYKDSTYFNNTTKDGAAAPQDEANPLGWISEYFSDSEKDSQQLMAWSGKDTTELRLLANALKDELTKSSTEDASSTYTPDYNALKSSVAGYKNTVAEGYYLLLDTLDGDVKDAVYRSTQSIPILVASTIPESVTTAGTADVTKDLGEVTLKASVPRITKQVVDKDGKAVTKPDYNIGEDIYYQLTTTIPDYTSYEKQRQLVVTDIAEEGLTIDAGSVKVKVEGVTDDLAKDTDYIVNTTKVNYSNPTAAGNATKTAINLGEYVNSDTFGTDNYGKLVTITIKAKLNSNAKISTPNQLQENKNKVSLTYSNKFDKVDDAKTINGGEVNVYTFKFQLKKTAMDGTTLLDGAKFKVQNKTTQKWLKYDADNAKWTEVDDQAAGDEFTSANGIVTGLDGLKAGTYTVKETKPAQDYTTFGLPSFDVIITPNYEADGNTKPTGTAAKDWGDYVLKTETVTLPEGTDTRVTKAADGTDKDYTIHVKNAKNLTELPMTGGAGLVAVIAVGVLLAGAGTAAAVRSRKSTSRAVRI